MTATRTWIVARVVHHTAWWVFVVSTVFAGGVTWLGNRRGYGPVVPDTHGVTYHGSYVPLNGAITSNAYSTAFDITFDVTAGAHTVPEVTSIVAVAIIVMSSLAQAVTVRHRVIGAAMVVVPLVACGIIAAVVPSTWSGVTLGNTVTMVIVLLAAGIHQLWMTWSSRYSRPVELRRN